MGLHSHGTALADADSVEPQIQVFLEPADLDECQASPRSDSGKLGTSVRIVGHCTERGKVFRLSLLSSRRHGRIRNEERAGVREFRDAVLSGDSGAWIGERPEG
jgi:hypothetical protein